MNLWDAPFKTPLKVLSIDDVTEEVRLVLIQLGLDQGEEIEKLHVAPLGDPLSFRVGEHVFTLRKELARKVRVEA